MCPRSRSPQLAGEAAPKTSATRGRESGAGPSSRRGTVNLRRIRPFRGRILLEPRPGINDLELVDGGENATKQLNLTIPAGTRGTRAPPSSASLSRRASRPSSVSRIAFSRASSPESGLQLSNRRLRAHHPARNRVLSYPRCLQRRVDRFLIGLSRCSRSAKASPIPAECLPP